MHQFRKHARTLGSKRAAIVVGAFAALALSVEAGVVLAGASPQGVSVRVAGPVARATPAAAHGSSARIIVGHSLVNDTSKPLRLLAKAHVARRPELETSPNPRPVSRHVDAVDRVRQTTKAAPRMPAANLNFDGIDLAGSGCSCAPPDTNGEVGATQFVEMVNGAFAVYNKASGALQLGPSAIQTVWSGLGGTCELNGDGDPVVLYDQLAGRWMISQFAGASVPTDECIAVSTSSDATGTWNRYDFNLGTDFFDYPHLGVWPDAYYLSMSVFNAAGTAYLGPQPFAFDRAAMLAGQPATYLTTRDPQVFTGANDLMLPADLDGAVPPPTGAPEPFLMSGENPQWPLWRFHVDFATPANSTFTLGGTVTPAGYTELCVGNRNCVPQPGSAQNLDGIGDRGMFRLAYRNFGTHESLVGNQSVSSSGVAGIRWYEIGNATSGTPAFAQQSTYQPDTTYRWMGSAAMDALGDLALGFTASNASTFPSVRYAGRLVTDPANTLAQGEATLVAGTGSQTATHHRWGDYSDLTVDPSDDCTFWYAQEYFAASGSSWKTRIGSFKFPTCHRVWPLVASKTGTGAGTVSSSVGGVNCGSACAASLDDGTSVTLTAAADAGSTFAGWSGSGCSGTATCTLTMDAAKTVTATFTLRQWRVTVARKGTGNGTVTSSPAGISCPGACTTTFGHGTAVTLSAHPAAGAKFTGWTGACTGKTACALSLTADTAVTATFAMCVVPKVTGLSLAKAKAKLAKASCRAGKVTKKAAGAKKRGKVVGQTPRAGKRLKAGSRVNLTVGR